MILHIEPSTNIARAPGKKTCTIVFIYCRRADGRPAIRTTFGKLIMLPHSLDIAQHGKPKLSSKGHYRHFSTFVTCMEILGHPMAQHLPYHLVAWIASLVFTPLSPTLQHFVDVNFSLLPNNVCEHDLAANLNTW